MRAARIAPAIAAISRPPSRRRTSSGSCEMLAMQRDGGAHRVGLAFQRRVVGAGAAADPVLRRAAVEAAIDRRRRGGVADAHFAQAQQVGAGGERLHAERHRRRAGPFVERRLARDVAGRLLERQLEHAQRNVEGLADLIDRRAAGGEIGDHRLGDRGRIGRDALGDDAVIAGEDGDQRRVDVGGAALPAGEPFGDVLQPAERTGGLGQLGLPRPRRVDRGCRRVPAWL